MAIKVKPMSTIVEHWKAGAQQGSADYVLNTVAAAGDYGMKTAAAGAAWKSGVNGPGADTRFVNNVRSKGQAKFARKVQAVGATRYSEGVNTAAQDYQDGFGPYVQVLTGLTLPARGPRGSPGNKAIAGFVSDALHNRRIGQTGAGR